MKLKNDARIHLFRNDRGWMSRSDDPAMRVLFGTDTIAMAFASGAPAETVLREIKRLNPLATVTIQS